MGYLSVACADPGEMTNLVVRAGSRATRISARVRRSGSDLLILVHGLGCAKESFDGAFESPALDHLSICAFDLPGYGDSERWHDQGYSLESYAEATIGVIEALRRAGADGRVFLVGHSMGGAVGLLAAERVPALGHCVSVEGNLTAEDCGLVSRQIASQMASEFVPGGYESFLRELRNSPRKDLRAWASWYAGADPAAVHQSATSLVQWSDSGKLLELFTKLPQTCSYIYGDEDGKHHLRPLLPHRDMHRIADAGHFAMVDKPDEFYDLLATLLSG
ncbi:alpha/beta fold hydrolase [Actinomadura sp. SCN-SB]|uniref:alpha/beta fold hydrolase n=1 Tax=Actinomadura sp. SCN-SB TaxID=3373092 RepID=UPI0037526A59